MPILKLPFVFDVEVLPSSRHRNVERAKLRDYTHVMVAELRSVDMELAIVATDGNGDASDPFRGEPYHLHGDHLYRRARHRATGETFDAASFEER